MPTDTLSPITNSVQRLVSTRVSTCASLSSHEQSANHALIAAAAPTYRPTDTAHCNRTVRCEVLSPSKCVYRCRNELLNANVQNAIVMNDSSSESATDGVLPVRHMPANVVATSTVMPTMLNAQRANEQCT